MILGRVVGAFKVSIGPSISRIATLLVSRTTVHSRFFLAMRGSPMLAATPLILPHCRIRRVVSGLLLHFLLLFGLLFVFLRLRLGLHNVVHQVLQIFVVHLFVAIFIVTFTNFVIFLGPCPIHGSLPLPVCVPRASLRKMVMLNGAVLCMAATLAI